MRRLLALLASGMLLVGLTLGPGAAGAAAVTTSAAGFVCHPHGTLGEGPSTTLSTVTIDRASPASSSLSCFFRGTSIPSSFGGLCRYEEGQTRVDFQRRILINVFGSARLLCWGGVITPRTYTLTTIVHYGGDGETSTFDSIVYTDGGVASCLAWPEDSTTACTATYLFGTVVTVTLTDDFQMSWECNPDFIENDTSAPFQGTCVHTMDADKRITVVGNLQL